MVFTSPVRARVRMQMAEQKMQMAEQSSSSLPTEYVEYSTYR